MVAKEATVKTETREDVRPADRLARAAALYMNRRKLLGGAVGGGMLVVLSRLAGVGKDAYAQVTYSPCCSLGCATCESCWTGTCCSDSGQFCYYIPPEPQYCCTCSSCQPYCQYCTCGTFEICWFVYNDGSIYGQCEPWFM